MRTLLRLIIFARKYWLRLSLAFTFLLIATAASLVIPRILGDSIDAILTQGERSLLLLAAGGILLASITRGLAAYGNSYLGESASQKIAYDIRNAIYDKLQRLSFGYHDSSQTGQLMSRATADVEAIRMFFSRGILGIAQTVILIIGISYLMMAMNWQLALLTLAFLPVIGWRAITVSNRLRPIWLKIQQMMATLGTILEENLTGVRIVKAFSRQPEESRKFAAQAQVLYDENIGATRQMAFNSPFMAFLISLATGLILWFGGWQVIHDNLTIGDLTEFILYLNLMAMPVRRLGFMVNILSRTTSAGERILEILDAESPVHEKPGAIKLNRVQGQVDFHNVNFSYNSVPVLRDIDFTAPTGKLVALVGGLGSGKSTIAHLIPRFYDVSQGSITIDGTDIRDVTLESLRHNIGIVQQDVFLFSATIRDNIAYGAVNASQDEIIAAARAAQLHDFVMSLPAGYNTWVGERGITLSGGEKQRVAIARTLLINPAILILDDSTSSVDASTEHLIRQALGELINGRTTFVITHRLPLIKNADLILVLENGVIVERGKHGELMNLRGQYQQIYQTQLAAAQTAGEV